jgi:hypothetical protein
MKESIPNPTYFNTEDGISTFIRNDSGRLLQRTVYNLENHNVDNLSLFSNPFTLQQRHKLNLHQKKRFSCRTEMSSKPNTLIKKNDKVTVNELRFSKERRFYFHTFCALTTWLELKKPKWNLEYFKDPLSASGRNLIVYGRVASKDINLMKPVDVSAGCNLPLRKHYCSYDYSKVPGSGHSRKRAGNLVALKRETVGLSKR